MASSPAAASQSGSEQPGAMDLTATTWKLSGAGMEAIDLAKFNITIEFTADKVSGFAGVNSYNGSYVAKRNGSIKFGPIATTKMAGDPDAMAAEAAYLKMLANANHYAADDAELTLIDPVGMTLKYSAAK
jgi:heat shock protein HslJ